jgi:Arc/MetJ family transcription regulator
MDLAHIAECTGLPPRTLRYVLEEGLLPAGKIASRGRGAVRDFTRYEAIVIAAAAAMAEVGVKRTTVRDTLRRLVKSRWTSARALQSTGRARRDALIDTATCSGQALLEIGDGVNCRLTLTPSAPGRETVSTGWIQLATGATLMSNYQPLARVVIDLGRIKEAIPTE